MSISKTNFIAKFKHHWSGFNIHKEFLRDAVDSAGEQLNEHDIDRLKISLNNMKEQLEMVENFIAENSKVPGRV